MKWVKMTIIAVPENSTRIYKKKKHANTRLHIADEINVFKIRFNVKKESLIVLTASETLNTPGKAASIM